MGDFNKELDASAEAARKVLAESEALLETAEKERQAYREWQDANRIDQALLDRFFASLPPEERKRVEQEQEALKLQHRLRADNPFHVIFLPVLLIYLFQL